MQVRDWLFVEDHCKAIDMVIRDGKIGEVYNVGGHNERPNIVIVKNHYRLYSENIDSEVGGTPHQVCRGQKRPRQTLWNRSR